MNYQQHLANSAAIRTEIQRFESVHPNIYSIYELLERVEEPLLQNQIREHVIAIEASLDWTVSTQPAFVRQEWVFTAPTLALEKTHTSTSRVQHEAPAPMTQCVPKCGKHKYILSFCFWL
ncbi:unnamed protein product [Arctogadus glacialis]